MLIYKAPKRVIELLWSSKERDPHLGSSSRDGYLGKAEEEKWPGLLWVSVSSLLMAPQVTLLYRKARRQRRAVAWVEVIPCCCPNSVIPLYPWGQVTVFHMAMARGAPIHHIHSIYSMECFIAAPGIPSDHDWQTQPGFSRKASSASKALEMRL